MPDLRGVREADQRPSWPTLADDGKVQVEYRPFVLLDQFGPYSARTPPRSSPWCWTSPVPRSPRSSSTCCSRTSRARRGPFPSVEELVQLAGQAGADAAAVQTAIDDGEGEDWVADATQAAEDLGVTGTPTVILNGAPFTDGRTIDDLAANLLDAVQ